MIHKDYSVGAPIQIQVHGDGLKIWNPGELPENWSVEKLLKQHSSRPFNPSVANAFFRAGEIEAWGRGIQRIFDACQEAGAPKPRIDYEPGDLWVEFTFSPEYRAVIAVDRVGDTPEKSSGKSSGKTPNQIIELVRQDSRISIPEMARSLKLTTRAVEKQLRQLKAAGRLRRIGPAKGGHWEVAP